MPSQASFQNGINLLSDSKGALSWLTQGNTWKHGGKLPVGSGAAWALRTLICTGLRTAAM